MPASSAPCLPATPEIVQHGAVATPEVTSSILGDVPAVGEPEHDVAPLIGTSFYRQLFFLCVVASGVLSFVSPLLGIVPQALALLLLVLWSVLVTVNAGRAKAETAYVLPPSPRRAGFWWLATFFVGVPVLLCAVLARRWADELLSDQQDTADMVRLAAIIVPISVFLFCWYWPLTVLVPGRTLVSPYSSERSCFRPSGGSCTPTGRWQAWKKRSA